MYRQLKRIGALALTVAMLVSMMVLPSANAAQLDETITLGFGAIEKTTTKVSGTDTEVWAVPVTATASAATFEVRAMELYVTFNKDALTLVKVSKGTIKNTVTVNDDDEEEEHKLDLSNSANDLANANAKGCYKAVFSDLSLNKLNHIATSGDPVMTMYFTEKATTSSVISFIPPADDEDYASKKQAIMTSVPDDYYVNSEATATIPPDSVDETTQYTVKFVNDDGTVLSSQQYEKDTPASAITLPSTPTKAPADGKTYTFKEWTPTIADVTADATYTATYDEADAPKTQYTVKFVNDDGTELSSQQYDEGTKAADIVLPSTPTKDPADGKTYTFKEWTPTVADVTADATYTATYDEADAPKTQYTVKFVNDDGTELSSKQYEEGTKAADIVLPSTPTKAPANGKVYTFKAWTPTVADVTADATYTATYDEADAPKTQYTVKFVNDDGTELSSKAYDEGTKAADIVLPSTPTKDPANGKVYTFKAWTPTVADVTADATYTATYDEADAPKTQYTVKFVNDDGTELSSKQYDEGTKAADIVLPSTPTKAPANGKVYTFKAWTPTVADVTADATYTATYDEADDAISDDEVGGCYVATAVYGSYDCPQVWTLRRFRDDVLAQTWYGRLFIKAYYAVSPACVKLFGDTEAFQNFFRGVLDPWVAELQEEGFESTPYNDIDW